MRKKSITIFILSLFYWPNLFSQEINQEFSISQVQSGDSYYTLLSQEGFTPQSVKALTNKKNAHLFYDLNPGLKFATSQSKIMKKFILFHPRKERGLIFWEDRSTSGLYEKKILFEKKISTFSQPFKGSLFSLLRNGFENNYVHHFFTSILTIFYDQNWNLREHPTRLSFSYESLFYGNEFLRYGNILKATLEKPNNSITKKMLPISNTFIHISDNYTPKHFFSPVKEWRVTSKFSKRRFHPIQKRYKPHWGVDLEVPTGSNIYPAGFGTIIKMGRGRASGWYVTIDHGNGEQTFYNHMISLSTSIKVGDQVSTLQAIGQAGCTGYCTKPHLHFGYKKDGVWKDPLTVTNPYPEVILDLVALYTNQNHFFE